MITLEQDNHDKLVVTISRAGMKAELQRFFRWRKGDFIERFYKLGSSDYDRFIAHLHQKGYGGKL